VLGPYAESGGFRLIIVEDCVRRSVFVPTQAAAKQAQAALLAELARPSVRTLHAALEEWTVERVRVQTCQSVTAEHQRGRLRLFFDGYLERELASLTAAPAARLYEELTRRPSPKTGVPLRAASHRFTLAAAKNFFKWCVEKGYVPTSPFEKIRPLGKVSAGKPQLRIEEARRFVDAAQGEFAESQHPLAIGVLLALLMGLRAGEVLGRIVRDVDDAGKTLWIDAGKTARARRHLEVPVLLRKPLLQLVAGRPRSAPLFAGLSGNMTTRQALHRMVRKLCVRAQVPRVCTHSLRGLYATLAVRSGAVTHAVAESLGHHSFAVTERHYAQPGAVADATTAVVVKVLTSKRRSTRAPR
jgi:integrase